MHEDIYGVYRWEPYTFMCISPLKHRWTRCHLEQCAFNSSQSTRRFPSASRRELAWWQRRTSWYWLELWTALRLRPSSTYGSDMYVQGFCLRTGRLQSGFRKPRRCHQWAQKRKYWTLCKPQICSQIFNSITRVALVVFPRYVILAGTGKAELLVEIS